jgi:hypothetical protein
MGVSDSNFFAGRFVQKGNLLVPTMFQVVLPRPGAAASSEAKTCSCPICSEWVNMQIMHVCIFYALVLNTYTCSFSHPTLTTGFHPLQGIHHIHMHTHIRTHIHIRVYFMHLLSTLDQCVHVYIHMYSYSRTYYPWRRRCVYVYVYVYVHMYVTTRLHQLIYI